ncbi:hypothetical protein Pmani_018357 [Petrolisthes manimaculis]|uniref:Uncharacterized protein n=1 Tax=Petrolisthes manimaculis TaxID=1843537 RepID=A0AAE1U4X3_9EUCA|nr:hypothetical protein Pmani_018357 [Petrolisthes manimaculis]
MKICSSHLVAIPPKPPLHISLTLPPSPRLQYLTKTTKALSHCRSHPYLPLSDEPYLPYCTSLTLSYTILLFPHL